MTIKNIIWLEPPRFSGGLKSLMRGYVQRTGINPLTLTNVCLTNSMLIKKSKKEFTWDESKRDLFEYKLTQLKPDLIVINDRAALGFITSKTISLALTRGSVFKYKLNNREIPCLVIDDVFKVKSTLTGGWILTQDLQKLNRWITGNQRSEPKFTYKVCRTRSDLNEFRLAASEETAIAMALDIETSGKGRGAVISCCGYTILDRFGNLQTFVIPLFDGSKSDGCFWSNLEDEIFAWETLNIVNMSSVPKTLQNGSYDCTYYVRYNIPINNWILDTMNLHHCIWTESRKDLAFITSLLVDHYQWWKDEGKEDEDDIKNAQVPKTKQGMENYWMYNAKDCYYTMLNTIYLSKMITGPQLYWALNNYKMEMEQVTGPAFAMSMRGVHVNEDLKEFNEIENLNASDKALAELRYMVNDDEFNPSSVPQVRELIYNVLKADHIPKHRDETGEPILKLVQTQHPLLDIIIEKIWEVKKPKNNASKYGQDLWLWGRKKRWLYSMNASGTTTGRYSSKSHNLWMGTQIQNPPYAIRPMIEADKGWILWSIDYAQSDAYFTAFGLEEENFIENMLSDKDTHCSHAAFFFQKAYEELKEGKDNDEDWCTHNVTGIRSITKRVVYGANYLMSGYTLFLTMGKKAVVAAAIHMGYADAANWSLKQYIEFCQGMLNSYFTKLYPGLLDRLKQEFQRAVGRNNLYQCAFGRTRLFFGNLLADNKQQRNFAAYIGQGGTAGNMNLAQKNIYYSGIESKDLMMLYQTHDDITGQVRVEKMHELIPVIDKMMTNQCESNDRQFIVPTDIKVGFGAGKRLMPYRSDLTIEEIKEYDRQWFSKNYDASKLIQGT